MKYKVTFNTHRYFDHSDSPKKGHLTVAADDPQTARDMVVGMREGGAVYWGRYIGLVFDAEPAREKARAR